MKKFKLNAIFFIPLKFALLKNKKDKFFFIKYNFNIKKLNKKMNNLDIRDIRRILKLNNLWGPYISHKNLKNIKNKRLILKLLEVPINFKEF